MTESSDRVQGGLPDAFPWSYLIADRVSGAIHHVSAQMERHYLGGEGMDNVNECFDFGYGREFADLAQGVEAGQSWHGQISPRRGLYGVTSVEVQVLQDPNDRSRVWICMLENPVVDGRMRLSSRSEFKLLQVLMDNTLEYVFFRDLNGRFIMCNSAFSDAIGLPSPDHAVGLRMDNLVSDKSGQWFREIDDRIRDTEAPVVNHVANIEFNGGHAHWLQTSTVPVKSDTGRLLGFVSVAREISGIVSREEALRRAMKDAEAASRAKSEFLAAMSHEIRTPINGIIGAAELADETPLEPDQRGYLDTILQCGGTLLALINDVLDFSKIEAGQLSLERYKFSPGLVIEEVGEEFAQIARKQGIEFIVSYGNHLPKYVLGDPTRLKQVLYNLVSNAIKFTPEGQVELRAVVEFSEGDRARVRFEVRDTGIGIEQSRAEAIFHSFTQADMSTTRKYGGSGLGLAICRNIVQLMGGELKVESEWGLGSTFYFVVDMEITESADLESAPALQKLRGLKVLVVDDNATNRSIYAEICSGWGFQVDLASDATSALQMLESQAEGPEPFRLMLLDRQMPDLSGLDLASLVRSREQLDSLEIILLSSSLSRDEMERAAKLSLTRALSKPIRRNRLLEVVLETFGLSGSEGRGLLAVAQGTASDPDKEEVQPPLRILLAEDNAVNQKIAVKRLENMGHEVTVARNGEEAVRLFETQAFDAVLMDVQMPVMDGFGAAAAIRAIEERKELPRIFICAMTAHAMEGDEEACLRAGMDDYISKPFKVERLRSVLRRGTEIAIANANEEDKQWEQLSFADYLHTLPKDEYEDILSAGRVFLQSLPEDRAALEQAIKRADYDGIAFQAHSFRGVAGVFNAHDITESASLLEQACRTKNIGAVRSYAGDLYDALEALETTLQLELTRKIEDG